MLTAPIIILRGSIQIADNKDVKNEIEEPAGSLILYQNTANHYHIIEQTILLESLPYFSKPHSSFTREHTTWTDLKGSWKLIDSTGESDESEWFCSSKSPLMALTNHPTIKRGSSLNSAYRNKDIRSTRIYLLDKLWYFIR